jgi:hypothetical protein
MGGRWTYRTSAVGVLVLAAAVFTLSYDALHVRHEAPRYRVGVKGPTSGLSQQPGEAGGSRALEAQGEVASSPDNDGTGRYRQTARVRQARREGVRTQKPVVEPPQASNRLQPGGFGPDSSARPGCRATSKSGHVDRPGGHEEGLRRTRGEAAGEELGTAPVNRCVANVGTRLGLPIPPASQAGGGQVRRRLMTPGGGGAPVVVRGRESRPHGQGGQQVRSLGTGRPGGRS